MLDDSRPGRFPVRVVYCCVPLEVWLVEKFRLKTDTAVLQCSQPESEEGIDRTSIYHPFRQCIQCFPVFQIITVEAYFDPIQQILHQFCITLRWDSLIQSIEVIVVESKTYRESPDDESRKILAVTAPLLLGIAFHKFFENVTAYQRDCLLFEVLRFSGNLLALFVDLCLCFLGCNHAPHFIKGIHIERQAV